MARSVKPIQESGSITANLNYCVDTGIKPVNETFGPGNTMRNKQGTYVEQTVTVFDGRAYLENFELETQGFKYLEHDTAVKDFYDINELETVYYPEVERLVKEQTGAYRVVIFDHTVRNGDEEVRQEKLVREPVKAVHNDFTEWSGPQRVRDILPDEAEELLRKRFAVIQVWRPINTTIQSDPLALCDARTIVPGDLIKATRKYPDRVGETYQIAYNPDHRWYYLPNMARNEAVIFKVYDSSQDGRARFTAHTSFTDPATPNGAPPRESIEMRTLAFFD